MKYIQRYLPACPSRGVALVAVLYVLVVLGIIAAAFAAYISMQARQGALSLEILQMNMLIRSGAEHTKALMMTQSMYAIPRSNQWVYVTSENGSAIGCYRLSMEDEAAKVNVNVASRTENSPGTGWSTSEINLSRALSVRPEHAQTLIHYRYGANNVPGARGDDDHNNTVLMADGIDNNANGEIDEEDEGINDPGEYNPYELYGDDRSFTSLNEMFGVLSTKLPEIKNARKVRRKIAHRATIFSEDIPGSATLPTDAADINCMNPREWWSVISKANQQTPFVPQAQGKSRLAVNLVDYRDENHVLSTMGSQYGVEAISFNEILANDASYIVHTDMLAAEPSHAWLNNGEMRKRYGSADDERMFYRVNTIYDCVPDDLPSRGWYSPCNNFLALYNIDPRLAWRVNDSGVGGSRLRTAGGSVTITMPRAPGENADGRLKAWSKPAPEDLPGNKEWCMWKTPPGGTGGGTFTFGSDRDWTEYYDEVMNVLSKVGKRNGNRPDFPANFFANTEVMIYTWPITGGGIVRRETAKAIGCFRISRGDESSITFDSRDVNSGKSFSSLMVEAGVTNAAGNFNPNDTPYDLSLTMRSWGNRSFIGLSPKANQMILLRGRQPKADKYYKIIIGRPAFGTYNDSYPNKLGVSGKVNGGFSSDDEFSRYWLYNDGDPVRTKRDGWMDLIITSSDEVRRNQVDQLITYFRVVAPEVVEMYNTSATPVSLANWRVVCNTGSLATEIGRITSVNYYDQKTSRPMLDVNPQVLPDKHFYLVNDTKLFDSWYGNADNIWGSSANEQIPVFQMDQDNWGVTFKIKSTENRAYVGMVFTLEGAENLDHEKLDLEVVKIIDEEGAGTRESWDGVFAPVVAEKQRMVNKGEIVTDNIGSFSVIDNNELAGKKMMILGLPHSGGMVSLTLKDQYKQVCARTVDYGKLEPQDLDVTMQRGGQDRTLWSRCTTPTIAGVDSRARNTVMRSHSGPQFMIKNGPYASVGELRRVSTGVPFEHLGMGAGNEISSRAINALASHVSSSHARLESCAGEVKVSGWRKGMDEVYGSTARSITAREGKWAVNQWTGHRIRFLTGPLRGESYNIFANSEDTLALTPNDVSVAPLSSPNRQSLNPKKGDLFALGPGYSSPLCYTRKDNMEGVWTWQRVLPPKSSGHLYVHGLNDRINTTEFLEENDNAPIDVAVWNWRHERFDTLIERAKYGKDDAFHAGVISTEHISPGGDFRIKLTSHNVVDPESEDQITGGTASGYAWFNYLTVTPLAVRGRVNVNTASARLLASLPGVSPKLAQNIARGIDSSGRSRLKPYKTLGDVLSVQGMTSKVFEKCSNILCVDSSVYTTEVEARIFPKGLSVEHDTTHPPPVDASRTHRFSLRREWDETAGWVITELEQHPVQ